MLRWLPAACWMCVIFALSSIPGSKLPGRYSSLGHFLAYMVLGILLAFALGRSRARPEMAAVAVLIASAYAVSDEFHQAFVPQRTPDVADWGMDTIGAFVGAFAFVLVARALRRRGRCDPLPIKGVGP